MSDVGIMMMQVDLVIQCISAEYIFDPISRL